MFGRFHDEEYDGIVLKIPLWFIKLNGLEPQFEQFAKSLSEAKRSMHYSDHTNNLYELDNYPRKQDILNAKKEARLKKEQEAAEFELAVKNGDILKLEWRDENHKVEIDRVHIEGVDLENNDILTEKYNIKSSFVGQLKQQKSCLDNLKKLSKDNRGFIYSINDCSEDLIGSDFNVSVSSIYEINISFKRLYVKTDYYQKRKNTYYRTYSLHRNEDGVLYYTKGNDRILLNEYEMKYTSYLIKKK